MAICVWSCGIAVYMYMLTSASASCSKLGRLWVFLPSFPGVLQDAYDELGNRYVIPVYCISDPTNLITDSDISGDANMDLDDEKSVPTGEEIAVKLRLSTGKDIKMSVRTSDTMLKIKRKLQAQEGTEPASQRWFYAGRMLTDKMTVEEAKFQTGYVVQVILPQPTPVES